MQPAVSLLQMPYFGLASLTDPAPQTLGATSFPCFGKASLPKVTEVAALFKRLQAACDANPNLRLSINVFDAETHGATVEAGGLRCSPAEGPLPLPSCAERELVTTVAGMKALSRRRPSPAGGCTRCCRRGGCGARRPWRRPRPSSRSRTCARACWPPTACDGKCEASWQV